MASELRIASEAVDRADLGEQLCGGDRCAPRQLDQRRRNLGCPLLELPVELRDRPVQAADGRDELAREPHLQLLFLAGEPAADPLQV